jgi:integration host factor subunit alpha
MVGKTITRTELCEAVYRSSGRSRSESSKLFELVLEQIAECLERGERVKLSSFGSFVVRKKGPRIGRNPKTGEEVPISPRRVLAFKPSAILMARINSVIPADIQVTSDLSPLTSKQRARLPDGLEEEPDEFVRRAQKTART